jgi:hypothetical protein
MTPATTQQFEAWAGMPPGSLDGWEAHGHYRGDELAAIAVVQGVEIHFAIAPEHRHRVIARHRTREFLAPLLDRRGYLTTRTVRESPSHPFLLRLGFAWTWRCENFDHYMLGALPFGKEH